MQAPRSSGSIPAFSVWVNWKPISPNQLLHKHWSLVTRNAKRAERAWSSSCLSSRTVFDCLTMIITRLHSNPSETQSPEVCKLTTEIRVSALSVAKLKPEGAKVSPSQSGRKRNAIL